jgi:hypothetical protein
LEGFVLAAVELNLPADQKVGLRVQRLGRASSHRYPADLGAGKVGNPLQVVPELFHPLRVDLVGRQLAAAVFGD